MQSLRDPIPTSTHAPRTVSRTFSVFNDASAQLLMQDFGVELLNAQPWLPDPASPDVPKMCLLLPTCFAQLLKIDALSHVLVPCPYSTGNFKTPLWFRKMLNPELNDFFRSTMDARGAAAQGPYLYFHMTDAELLADEIRRVIAGTSPQTDLISWAIKLQSLADSCQPCLTKRKWNMATMIRFLFYADHLKDINKLRVAIDEACKLALPVDI